MEEKIKIRLNKTENIRKFTQVARSFSSDIDVMNDKTCIDGKSILGLFTLDLSKTAYAKIISDNKDEIRRFNEVMKEFV